MLDPVSASAIPVPVPAGDAVAVESVQRLRAICLALPEAREGVSRGKAAFRAGGRPFAMLRQAKGRESLGVRSGPRGWSWIVLDAEVDWHAAEDRVVSSYRRVAGKRMLVELERRRA
jgi:predicted DNA-binding protein (MmcQ/YjbR family)